MSLPPRMEIARTQMKATLQMYQECAENLKTIDRDFGALEVRRAKKLRTMLFDDLPETTEHAGMTLNEFEFQTELELGEFADNNRGFEFVSRFDGVRLLKHAESGFELRVQRIEKRIRCVSLYLANKRCPAFSETTDIDFAYGAITTALYLLRNAHIRESMLQPHRSAGQ